jgi:uncharacterized protein
VGLKQLALAVLVLLALLAVTAVGVGEWLIRPAMSPVGDPPKELSASAVSIPNPGHPPVAGWLSRGTAGSGAVLLLHGVRSDRRQMIARAKFLRRLGYSVLMIDLPGHGESEAKHITFGANESTGVNAALAYLKGEFPAEPIAAIGVSLGAASLVLARPSIAPEAVVLESMYPTLKDAVRDRIRLNAGPWAEPLAPLLLIQLPWRIGVTPSQLRPVDALPALQAPVLIASGSADQHTTLAETRQLFEAAGEPKSLWIVERAAHVDLHAFAPVAYEARISAFLAEHMAPGTRVANPRSNGAR